MTQISWLKTIDIYFPTIRKTRSLKKRCHQGSFPLVALKEKLSHASFMPQFVVFSDFQIQNQFLLLCSYGFVPSESLCVPTSSYKDISHWMCGPAWIKNDVISRSLTNDISKDDIFIKIASWGSVYTWSLGNTIKFIEG